jgi:integrase
VSHTIHLARTRNALKARREPYWGAPLSTGRYVGVRKLEDGTCTWIARARDDHGKQKYRSLGQITDRFDFNAARREAEKWFRDFDAGVHADRNFTVKDACVEYLEDLEAEGRYDAAKDAEIRFRATVYDHPVADVPLEKLRTRTLRDWRNKLEGTKATQNRNLTAIKAALNHAVENRQVNPSKAQEWRAVKAHEDADNRRDIFLDLTQRRALLNACEGALRDLVEAAMLTGARPGELVNATRNQFDSRTGILRLTGKRRTRNVPLSAPAVALFTRLSKDKLPGARLLLRDDGTPWIASGRQGWTTRLRAIVKAAGLPQGSVLYSMRHAFITEALMAGMPTLHVAKITGTSLKMIEKHYGHLVAESAREGLAKVELI